MTKRSYTETEKIGTMLLALEQGVAATVEQTAIPRPTIYEWFRSSGGLPAVRTFLEETVFSAKSKAMCAVYDAIRRSADGDSLSAEMVEALGKLVVDRAEAKAAAQAGAQATLQVVIQGTGEVIEVPRDG
jgi:hypothetical protein